MSAAARPARVLVATWAPGGNLPPLVAVASLLAERGHDVEVIGSAATRGAAERAGLAARAYRRAPEPDPSVAFERQAAAMLRTASSLDVARDVAEAVEATHPGLVVCDCMLPAALAGAEAAGARSASIVHFLYGPARDSMRERGHAWTTDLGELNAARSELGLPRFEDGLAAWEAPALLLVSAPRWLDLDADFPAHVAHAGPLGVRIAATPEAAPGAPPRVLLSFSTTVMEGQVEAVRRACDAAAGIDVDALLTLGPAIDAHEVQPPAGMHVKAWADHDDLLPGCAAVLSHAGLGTALRALAHGVPLVMLPLGRDQALNAGRIEALDAGIALAPHATAAAIRSALEAVLSEPGYRAAARAAAARIAADEPERRAVEALEWML